MDREQNNKHILWIDQAHRFSFESKDRSTQVGCVLVAPNNRFISSGWNGFPEGVNDEIEARHARPAKYEWTICAEQNALNNAARLGHATEGATAYMNWEPNCPCAKCMGNLRNAGIVRIIGPNRPFTGKGHGTYYSMSTVSKEIAEETGIQILMIDYDLEGWKKLITT